MATAIATRPSATRKKAKIEEIPASELTVDDRVQREVERGAVRKLKENWDDLSVGVLIGSRREDGRVRLIDGQQRWNAKRDDDPGYKFKVLVHENLTLEEEAHIFIHANKDRKVVGAFYLYRVQLAAKDPIAHGIKDVCDGLGLTVDKQSKGARISCITVMRRVVEYKIKYKITDPLTSAQEDQLESNKQDLEWALTFYDDTWGSSDPQWRGEMVEALAAFHRKYHMRPEFDTAKLMKKLRGRKVAGENTDVISLLGSARKRSIGNNRVVGPLVEVLQEVHDHGSKKHRLEAPRYSDDD